MILGQSGIISDIFSKFLKADISTKKPELVLIIVYKRAEISRAISPTGWAIVLFEYIFVPNNVAVQIETD